jgi:hypothetical protein
VTLENNANERVIIEELSVEEQWLKT